MRSRRDSKGLRRPLRRYAWGCTILIASFVLTRFLAERLSAAERSPDSAAEPQIVQRALLAHGQRFNGNRADSPFCTRLLGDVISRQNVDPIQPVFEATTANDSLGCPTPYIVFRYDTGIWVRVSLADLPRRFARMNLYPNPSQDRLRAQGYFIRAAETATRYKESYAPGDEYALRATVDRRIRNPRSLGCGRASIERIYGVEKYDEWKGTGTWLDKSEAEALNLLRRKSEGSKQ